MVKIFDYFDYRLFLKDSYQAAKARNPAFTHRYIENKAGLKSAGHFAQILQGRCNISPAVSARLSAVLQLKKKESDYFEALVFYGQAKTHEEKNRYFSRLMAFKETRHRKVAPDQHEFYGRWYFSAVRELLDIRPFRGDHARLGRAGLPQGQGARGDGRRISLGKGVQLRRG